MYGFFIITRCSHWLRVWSGGRLGHFDADLGRATRTNDHDLGGYLLAKHQSQPNPSLVKGNTIDTNKSSGK